MLNPLRYTLSQGSKVTCLRPMFRVYHGPVGFD